jgi:predicted porin
MNTWLMGAGLAIACLGTAHAESTTTLYGLLYTGLRHVNDSGGNSVTGLATGPSRWGFKGTESLGNGRSALFVLESGFDVSSGSSFQGRRLFGRQAFVGVSDVAAGRLTAGRQYDMVADFLAPYAATGKWNGYMAHIGDNDNLNYQFRLNNSIKYVSPEVGGFQAGGVYAFGESAGSGKPNSASSAGLRYRQGGFSAAAGYLRVNNPATSVSEGNWNTIVFPAVTPTSAMTPAALTPNAMTTYGIGTDYQVGKVKAALVYTQTRFDALASTAIGLPVSDVRFRNLEANVSFDATGNWMLGAGYAYTTGDVAATRFKPKYHQVHLMTNYSLSKRTILQLATTHQRAAGDAHNAYVLYSSDSGASRGRSQTALLAGMFHFF